MRLKSGLEEIVSFVFPRVPIPKHLDLKENKSSWFPEVFL